MHSEKRILVVFPKGAGLTAVKNQLCSHFHLPHDTKDIVGISGPVLRPNSDRSAQVRVSAQKQARSLLKPDTAPFDLAVIGSHLHGHLDFGGLDIARHIRNSTGHAVTPIIIVEDNLLMAQHMAQVVRGGHAPRGVAHHDMGEIYAAGVHTLHETLTHLPVRVKRAAPVHSPRHGIGTS